MCLSCFVIFITLSFVLFITCLALTIFDQYNHIKIPNSAHVTTIQIMQIINNVIFNYINNITKNYYFYFFSRISLLYSYYYYLFEKSSSEINKLWGGITGNVRSVYKLSMLLCIVCVFSIIYNYLNQTRISKMSFMDFLC